MARKTGQEAPTGLWSSDHLRAWKELHPGRDEKVADVLSVMLIRNKLKFDIYEFTVLHFIRCQLGRLNFRPAFTILVKLFRNQDGTLNQIVLNPHLFYCLISAMSWWLERPVVSHWVKALKDLDEGDFRIGIGAATLEGSAMLRQIKEEWDAREKGDKTHAEPGHRKRHAEA